MHSYVAMGPYGAQFHETAQIRDGLDQVAQQWQLAWTRNSFTVSRRTQVSNVMQGEREGHKCNAQDEKHAHGATKEM